MVSSFSSSTSRSGGSGSSDDILTPTQLIALVTGTLFTLIGVFGFFVTGFSGFAASSTGDMLFGFELNPLHNVVHLALGLAGLAMWRTHAMAHLYGLVLFAGYGATFVYGLFTVNSASAANFLSLNSADNGLHLVAAIIGLAAALMPATARHGTISRHRPSAV